MTSISEDTRGSKPGAGTNTLLVPIRLKNFQSGVGTGVHTLLIVSSGLLLIVSGFGEPHTIECKLELHSVGCFNIGNSQKLTFFTFPTYV